MTFTVLVLAACALAPLNCVKGESGAGYRGPATAGIFVSNENTACSKRRSPHVDPTPRAPKRGSRLGSRKWVAAAPPVPAPPFCC